MIRLNNVFLRRLNHILLKLGFYGVFCNDYCDITKVDKYLGGTVMETLFYGKTLEEIKVLCDGDSVEFNLWKQNILDKDTESVSKVRQLALQRCNTLMFATKELTEYMKDCATKLDYTIQKSRGVAAKLASTSKLKLV